MAAIERDHGELPVTVRQLTGGGGEHVLFRAPADLDPVGSLGPGLQVKYAGYLIAAPSKHEKTRRPYAWSVDHHPLDVPVAEPPDWLRTLLRKPTAENGRPLPTDWKNAGLFDVRVGDGTTTLTRLAGLLFRKSVDPIAAYALLAAWNLQSCHPPLGAEKFEKTLEGIRNRELARRAAR